MPLVQKHLIREGTTFKRHYCTITVCCPARVSIMTGMTAHNTNVTDLWLPYGAYPKFIREGLNDDYIPVWFQQEGYSTYYVGKFLNSHDITNYDKPEAAGWTQSDFLLGPYTYEYENAYFSRNGAKPVSYRGQYSPDVTADKAYGFLDEALEKPDQPFFLAIAPIAPHADMVQEPYSGRQPKYAERHSHLFKDYKIPRTENFNPEKASGVAWISRLPRLNDTVIEYNDEYQRCRLRALQSVDEMVAGLVERLDRTGELDNTYIVYTTDNGYHISQHRMHRGKSCGLETDVNVPMIVRGPGVERDFVSEAVTAHTDIAPTLLSIIGAPLRRTFDGTPMPLFGAGGDDREHVSIEYWGATAGEGWYGFRGGWGGNVSESVNGYINNTYKSVRLIGQGYNLYYSVWCTNEVELYDMTQDPGQLRNLLDRTDRERIDAAREFSVAGRPLNQVLNRFDAAIMILKDCKGDSCRDPWGHIHAQASDDGARVRTLTDALDTRYGEFYTTQPKLRFLRCEMGHIPESETTWDEWQPGGPFKLDAYAPQQPLDNGRPHWSDFV